MSKQDIKTIRLIGYLVTNPLIQVTSPDKAVAHFLLSKLKTYEIGDLLNEENTIWKHVVMYQRPKGVSFAKLKKNCKVCVEVFADNKHELDDKKNNYLVKRLVIKNMEILSTDHFG